MKRIQDTIIEAMSKHLTADGADGIGLGLTSMFQPGMRLVHAELLSLKSG